MPYSRALTAELSGTSVRQLDYWRTSTPPVLRAERSVGSRVLYSFRDLVAARTVSRLRQDTSLQKIRRALESLVGLGHTQHLAAYKLIASGDTVVLVRDDESVDLVKYPGNHLLIDLRMVLVGFSGADGRRVPNLQRPRRHLSLQPDVLGGIPVAAGSRVAYSLIAELVFGGVPPDQVSRYYPAVGAAAARDAADLARVVEMRLPVAERRLIG